MTKVQLIQLKNAELSSAERVDAADVKVDSEKTAAARLEQYLLQVKNPYAFKCGEIAVNVCFLNNGRTLNDALTAYLKALKKTNKPLKPMKNSVSG